MNINKRLDRMKQWAGERMGGEVKTGQTDEFKMLEAEMQLRHEGMERMQRSMTTYIKSLTKVKEAEDKEKQLPIAYLGSTMVGHGDDFEPESEFGQCLSTFGRANERIARMQENYVSNATSSWMESVERSLAQMKEYQAARKKLESRRLAFDTSQVKLNKSKKEDFRMEEELRAQKAKYEESQDDVHRRMMDIKEAEADSIADLTAFLDAELAYYDRAREVLLQLRKDWPTGTGQNGSSQPIPANNRNRPIRSRSNTTSSFRGAITEDPEEDVYANSPSSYTQANELRPPPSFSSRSRAGSNQSSPRRELPGFDLPTRPSIRTNTFEGGASYQSSRDASPAAMTRLSRIPTDGSMGALIAGLRPTKRTDSAGDVFGDPDFDRAEDERSVSPAGSYDSRGGHGQFSRSASWSVQQNSGYSNGGSYGGGQQNDDGLRKKVAPPPPPPNRAKKPPPPPPPMKRSALSSSELPRY